MLSMEYLDEGGVRYEYTYIVCPTDCGSFYPVLTLTFDAVRAIFNNLQPFLPSNSNIGLKSYNNFHDSSLLPLVCVITLVLHTVTLANKS